MAALCRLAAISASAMAVAEAAADLGAVAPERVPVPDGQGCFVITDPHACCEYVDGRPEGPYGNQECVPARAGTSFKVMGSRGKVLCQPRCWAEGTCGDGGNQSARTGFCGVPEVAPLPASAVVQQAGAQIPVGGDLQFYVVGSSNAAWQNWPDMLHGMLRRLGYNMRIPRTEIPGESYAPLRQTPKCADAASYETLSTPRLGLQGWSSWGFSYESEDDCDEHGYRRIAGWNVSCTNGWACTEKWRGDVPFVPVSTIAKGVRDANVVVLANFVNDGKSALYCPHDCFGDGATPDYMNSTVITATNLKLTIRAIHAENPDVVVLVLARYADAKHVIYVRQETLERSDGINAAVREQLVGEPNTYFVDLHFPLNVNMFQTLHSGHANCRGDKIMASSIVEAMFQHKILEKGMSLADEGACLANADCASMDPACCQRSALCYVDSEGACSPFGPGAQ